MPTRERVLEKFAAMKWPYASQDPAAFAEISHRVADVGRDGRTLTYTELVKGIDFQLNMKTIRLGVPEWIDFHREILGDFLGYLCMQTYAEGGFMGSVLVVSAAEGEPAGGYRKLMGKLGLLGSRDEMEFLDHWNAETKKAQAWYRKQA